MKVFNYVYIAITMMLFLTFLGIQLGGFTQLFDLLAFSYEPSTGVFSTISLTTSNFFDILFGSTGLLVALGVSVFVGVVTRSKVENLIILPFITGTLVLFLQAFGAIMNAAMGANTPSWATAIIVIVLFPFTAGFILSLVEFFRGTD